MENVTRTIYSSLLQTALLMKLPFTLAVNSTLNEKFSIQSGVAPDIGDLPAMRYYAIGNGGHKMSIGASGVAKTEPIQHKGTDAALFNHIPFILREKANDISAAERVKYALRKTETHQGRQYFAYYLKRMTLTDVIAAMEYVTVSNGTSTVTAFVPDSSNLNPVPSDLSSTGINVVAGDYASATAKVGLILSKADVDELLNVAKVIYDDENLAIISEIALCSGIDKVIATTTINNASINFNEAIAVQVLSFINTFFPLKFSNNGVELLLDVGSTEPVFLLT